MNEWTLALGGLGTAKSTMGVEDRQMGEADSRGFRSLKNAKRILTWIRVGYPVFAVVKIVKLHHASETALEKFTIQLGGNSLDVFG